MYPDMTYHEALDFWFSRVNFELKSPHPADLKLDRIRRLLTLLGNPHERLRIVHVAGSKGKGSTSAMLASILAQAGYRVGLFTSPHLVHVEERIQVNRQPIGASDLTALMEEIRTVSLKERWGEETLAVSLTFFEIATALGFLHFARKQVDLAVVEVGLGGRFDSTNVCEPLLAIITSISFDHTQYLGNTLASIAREKAGIIKLGVPVISGVRDSEARDVMESIAAERHAPLVELDRDFDYVHAPARIGPSEESWPLVTVRTGQQRYADLRLGLLGEHQAANAAVAVAAVEELERQGIAVGKQALASGLAQVSWPARLEIVGRQPLILLDCAHNVASVRALVEALRTSFPLAADARRWLIFAGSRDKDLRGMFAELGAYFDRVLLTSFTSSRAMPPDELRDLLPAPLVSGAVVIPTPAEALAHVLGQVQRGDLLCVTGSVFLAGELRPRLVGESVSAM